MHFSRMKSNLSNPVIQDIANNQIGSVVMAGVFASREFQFFTNPARTMDFIMKLKSLDPAVWNVRCYVS